MKPQHPELRGKADMIFDFTTYPQRRKFSFGACMFFTRTVEVYLDEIAVGAYRANIETASALGVNPTFLDIVPFISLLIATTMVHEWLHAEENLEEGPTQFATQQVEEALRNENWPEGQLVQPAEAEAASPVSERS